MVGLGAASGIWLNIHLIDLFMQNMAELKAASGRNAWQSGRGCVCLFCLLVVSAYSGSLWRWLVLKVMPLVADRQTANCCQCLACSASTI